MNTQMLNRVAVAGLSFGILLGLPACAQTEGATGVERWQPPAYGEAFGEVWYDGRAELASYELVYPRYGEMRKGTAVAVTVTEPFRWSPRVKADRVDDETFNVVKLNLSEDFPTGVYDYNVMTSVFVGTSPGSTGTTGEGLSAGVPVKLTFSSQEWCGHVWEQAAFGAEAVDVDVRSYFERAADRDFEVAGEPAFLAEDALFLWARGLAGPVLEAGASVDVPLWRSSAVSRFRHVGPGWDTAVLTRGDEVSRVRTEALGDVSVRTMFATVSRAESAGGGTETYVFTVEDASPHRVVQVRRDDGYSLTLVGVSREPYWSQQSTSDEAVLERIGMQPRGPMMP
ncbi:MAG: hypothetical protein AAF916_09905 [Planctomycetota bacterium]